MASIIQTLINLIIFIIILGIIILVHEGGHFLFAKLSHTYVYEFAIGMGKKLFSFRRKNDETEYTIRLIPIGGYNSIAGENGALEEEDDDGKKIEEDRLMCNKSFIQRFLILFAGPGFNFILTFVVLLISALIFGSTSTKPIIGTLDENYPAYQEGIREKDKIISIDGKKINSWEKAIIFIQTSKKKELNFVVEDKEGNIKEVTISPIIQEEEDGSKTYIYGISKDNTITHGIIPSIKYAINETESLFYVMFYTVKSLFTGNVSINDMSGPVGIYTIVGDSAKNGLSSLLYILAYLSIDVGVINLIPFPAFDGGRILFLIIEKITRKPLNPKIENILNTIGFIILMGLMLVITGHDIINLVK